MKKLFSLILLLIVFTFSQSTLADDNSVAIENFKSSATAKPFFNSSYGYAIFPTIGKGGFGVGAAHGKGTVYKNGSKVGTSKMTQLSIGFQVGGQAYSQIIFFQDKRSFEEFTSGNFEFSADASAVALTASVQAQAGSTGTSSSLGTDADSTKQNKAKYRKGMAVMTLAKGGLMYEAAIAGQKYSYKKI